LINACLMNQLQCNCNKILSSLNKYIVVGLSAAQEKQSVQNSRA